MIEFIPDDDWMLRDDIQWAFDAICSQNLTFDAVGFPRHLENFLKILKKHDTMRVVIDHCMKPQIARHSEESIFPLGCRNGENRGRIKRVL